MERLYNYVKSESAATSTVELVLLTVGVIVLAGYLIYKIIGALQTSSEKSSCSGNNEVFCTE